MPWRDSNPAIPSSERRQTNDLDRVATGFGYIFSIEII